MANTKIKNKNMMRCEEERNHTIYFLRDKLAKKSQSLVWGKGFIFESSNDKKQKYIDFYAREFKLLELMASSEKLLSFEGRAVIVFDKQLNGDVKMNIATPYFYQAVGKIFNNPNLAVIYQRVVVGNKNNIIRSTYTDKIVRHELFDSENEQSQLVFNYREKLGELGIMEYWEHNLGFVPLFEVHNLPHFDYYYNTMMYHKISDWFDGVWIEDLIIDAVVNLRRELWLNHSRILIDNADQKLIQNITENIQEASGRTLPDKIISDYIIAGDGGSNINIVGAQSTFTDYINTITSLIDVYLNFSLSSSENDSSGAQKTSAETKNSRSNLVEFIEEKARHRTIMWSNILHKFLVSNGMGKFEDEYDFSFKIIKNLIQDDTSLIDNFIKQVQVGSKSIIDMISTLDGIGVKEAKTKYEYIKSFNKENDIETNLSVGGGANVPNTNGKGGAPDKKVDKEEKDDKPSQNK